MARKRYIPRWFSSEIIVSEITPGRPSVVDPDVFMNKTAWPFKIEHLTVFGYPLLTPLPFNRWGGVGPLFEAEIGMSGATDINLVPAPISSAYVRTKPYIQLGDHLQGTTFAFEHPYLLPRDSGFTCSMLFDSSATDITVTQVMRYGVALHGYKVQSMRPAMFAASHHYLTAPEGDVGVVSGNTLELDSVDLLNDGEEDVMITHMQLTFAGGKEDLAGRVGTDAILACFYWKINPLSGLPWMNNFVPISGITPYVQHANTRRGIMPYTFTPNEPTYLYRRQRLGLRFRPLELRDLGDQLLNITMFGYLEVQ